MMIPSSMLKGLYKKGSLRNAPEGLEFTLKNTLSTAYLTSVEKISVDGTEYPVDKIEVIQEGDAKPATAFSTDAPLTFNKGAEFTVRIKDVQADPSTSHMVVLVSNARTLGTLKVEIGDMIASN